MTPRNNGVRIQGFLYQDQLKPVAELDGEGGSGVCQDPLRSGSVSTQG